MRRLFVSLALVALSACETGGDVQSAMLNVSPGMSKADVVTLLGAPVQRSFREGAEALQYCETGLTSSKYATVWLVDGQVMALTTQTDNQSSFCTQSMPEVNWGQVPADVSIAMQIN